MATPSRRTRTLLLAALGSVALWGGLRVAGHFAGAARWRFVPLDPGTGAVPQARTLAWNEQSPETQALLADWASQPLPNWHEEGKVNATRVLMAKFALRRDLDAANGYLRAQVPWGRSGSTWELHPEGDYDFTEAALTAILYLYGDDGQVLYPETREHLLDVLLVEEGGSPRTAVPRTLGLIRDTENHLLMTEGSRYLKNRWLMLHGSTERRYDNARNGMEAWMLGMLNELATAGLYEFNSIPYMGYTLTALLNLEAYGSDDVRVAAREVLDQANWTYALGSLDFRRFAPFRRQLRRADLTALDADYQTAMVETWMSLYPGEADVPAVTEGTHHAVWAALMPYRLPDEMARWILSKPETYFVRIGHGRWASPELYAGGPGYLLSAGGVYRGARSMIVARPITLLLSDPTTPGVVGVDARDLSQVLHLAGPGDTFKQWNNTGVARDLAVAAGPVFVPEGWVADAADDVWQVYTVSPELSVAVHSQTDLGLVAIFHDGDAAVVLDEVSGVNDDAAVLNRLFQWPDGVVVTYNVDAPKRRWVIANIDGHPVDRDFGGWPLIEE